MLAAIGWLVLKMQGEREVEKMEGCKTDKTNDSTQALIIVKRVSQREKKKGMQAHKKEEKFGPQIAWLFQGQTRVFLY